MGTRGWRLEQRTTVADANGTPVQITTGLVRDQYGRTHVGLAVGDGPSALLDCTQVILAINQLHASGTDLLRDGDDR